MKQYLYYFVDLGLSIFADSGDEAYEEYHKLYDEEYEGIIQLTDIKTSFMTEMLPISI